MRRLAIVLLLLPLASCGRLAGVFGGSTAAAAFDAHVVYAQRAGCPALVARTLEYGYTVMAPLEADAGPFDLTGLFEGPIREGESVFRYTPPNVTPVWTADAAEVSMDVLAVQLDLPAARALLASTCGVPDGTDGPSDGIPRLPGAL